MTQGSWVNGPDDRLMSPAELDRAFDFCGDFWLDERVRKLLYSAAWYARAYQPPTSLPAPAPPTLSSAALALRDLLDAIEEFRPPGDILEGCTNVKQTYAGDYDCDGCKACGLYYEMQAAEKFIDRIDIELERSSSSLDVPIPPA